MCCTRKQYFRNAISDLNVRGMRGALIMGSAYLRAGGLNRRFTVLHFHSAHAPLNCDDGGRLPYKFICILLIDNVIIGLNLGTNFDLIFTTFIPDEDTRLECRNVES